MRPSPIFNLQLKTTGLQRLRYQMLGRTAVKINILAKSKENK